MSVNPPGNESTAIPQLPQTDDRCTHAPETATALISDKKTDQSHSGNQENSNTSIHLPFTLSSLAAIPPNFTTIPDGKQETEGGGSTAGQDMVMGFPHKRSGST